MFIKSEWVKPASDLQILLAKKLGTQVIGTDEDGTQMVAYVVGDHIYVTDIVYKEKEMEQKKPKFKVGDKVKCINNTDNGAEGMLEVGKVYTVCDTDGGNSIFLEEARYNWSDSRFELAVDEDNKANIPFHKITYFPAESCTKIEIEGKLSRETVDGIVKLLHENRMA